MITTKAIQELFKKYEDEFLQFTKVEKPRHKRHDINAMLLLAELLPNDTGSMVNWAEHDEIGLEADLVELAKVATDEQILELVRSGVRLGEYDNLVMFV